MYGPFVSFFFFLFRFEDVSSSLSVAFLFVVSPNAVSLQPPLCQRCQVRPHEGDAARAVLRRVRLRAVLPPAQTGTGSLKKISHFILLYLYNKLLIYTL